MLLRYKTFNINRLREHRLKRGITISHMARELGYKSTSGYANIENGKVDLTVVTALKIAEILDVDFEVLFFEWSYTK